MSAIEQAGLSYVVTLWWKDLHSESVFLKANARGFLLGLREFARAKHCRQLFHELNFLWEIAGELIGEAHGN